MIDDSNASVAATHAVAAWDRFLARANRKRSSRPLERAGALALMKKTCYNAGVLPSDRYFMYEDDLALALWDATVRIKPTVDVPCVGSVPS